MSVSPVIKGDDSPRAKRDEMKAPGAGCGPNSDISTVRKPLAPRQRKPVPCSCAHGTLADSPAATGPCAGPEDAVGFPGPAGRFQENAPDRVTAPPSFAPAWNSVHS